MIRRTVRLLGHLAGLALVVVVVLLVGLEDRVTDTAGREHRGRIVQRTETEVVLETGAGEERLAISGPGDVQPGLKTAFATLGARPGLALLGVLVHLLALFATHVRWGLLLRGADLATPWGTVLRLGFVGHFMSGILPGGVGTGDLVKAFYVARTHGDRKTRAVVSVFMDRVIGVFVLCGIAVVAVLFAPAGTRIATARGVVLALFGTGAVLLALLLSRRARAALGLTRVPLPRFAREAGEAAVVYGRRPGLAAAAALLSVGGHALFFAAFYCYAGALGETLGAMSLLVAIPVAQIVAAVPGLPGGWGVGDAAFVAFLPETGVLAAKALALSFTYRLLHLLLSLPGGLWLFRHRREVHVREIERAMEPAFSGDR